MAKKKKDNRLIFLIGFVVFILAIANLYILTNKPLAAYCYNDVCLIGKENPVAEASALINTSSKAIIVAEGDTGDTQKTPFLMAVMMILAKDFGNKKEQIIGIKMDSGQAIECICSDFDGKNFTDCPSNSTAYCTGIEPKADEIMLKVPYPDFSKNEIIIDNRTITFKAISGQDALVVVQVFEDIFIHKVVR